jgi:hypothetical protein
MASETGATTGHTSHQLLTIKLGLSAVIVGIVAGFGVLLWSLTDATEILYATIVLLTLTVALLIAEYAVAVRPQLAQLRKLL